MATRESKSEEADEHDENARSYLMDLQSRTGAALGWDTMKNLSSLRVLIIGLRGVGVETAKNLILTGPQNVTLYDDNIVRIADLGANFYLSQKHVGQCTRSEACTKILAELNPYCDVTAVSGELKDDFIQSFGAVVITQTLPRNELNRINQLCRSRTNADGKSTPGIFILAVTHGITAHFFSDFGASHTVTDADGEPTRVLVIDDLNEDGIITVAAKRHGFDDGDSILIEDIEGVPDEAQIAMETDDAVYIEKLNNLPGLRVKRIYYKYDYKRPDGRIEPREKQVFEKLRLDLSQTSLAGKQLSTWKTGGLVNEVKPSREYKFRPFVDTLTVPATEGLAAFFGPQHPDQGAWEQGAGKLIHLLYATALEFQAQNGFFPRLHNEDDSRQFLKVFRGINESNAKLQEEFNEYSSMKDEEKKDAAEGVNGACFVEKTDMKRLNGYAWYFATELTGYCAFLGGVAAQEVVKKFGKYTPVYQWLHCDHIQLIGTEIPSDAMPSQCRYDDQIAIFGKAFQRKLGEANIFLVGTGALGCEYLKGLSLMGVCCGPTGKLTCTDMDRIEISNLSRQFLFRAHHVGKPKSTTAAAAAKDMNPAFNVEALEMKVWPETEDKFDDVFWDNLDLCWNALDNVHARKYTDNKCLLHSKPLLESGTQGTKCNSEVILPYKTKSYNDGDEQETEGIPMCTLQNFPYLPIHCIEWARSSFNRFESQPKLYNTFINSFDKFLDQVNTAKGAEKYQIVKIMEKFIGIDCDDEGFALYSECVRFSFDEFVEQHITRIKNLIYLFPEDEKVKDKDSGEILGDFWTGHKKFPNVPKYDISDENVVDYLYSSSQLYAFMFNVPDKNQPGSKADFVEILKNLGLTVATWVVPTGLKIKVDDDEEEQSDDEDAKEEEAKEQEIVQLLASFKNMNRNNLLTKMNETEFEKDDDKNFHIDLITAVANTRARNYRIKETSRHKCKIIAGKIIAALATTTAMICGLVELEFYKLKLGLAYVQQNSFYNANINLAVAQFQFFEPDAATRAEVEDIYDPVMCMNEKHVPYPPNFTSWDSLVVDRGDLSIGEFVEAFPQLFGGNTVDLLHKLGKMEKGIVLYNDVMHRKKQAVLDANLIEKYIEAYGKLVSDKRNYVLLTGAFFTKDNDVAKVPRIKYYFK